MKLSMNGLIIRYKTFWIWKLLRNS